MCINKLAAAAARRSTEQMLDDEESLEPLEDMDHILDDIAEEAAMDNR